MTVNAVRRSPMPASGLPPTRPAGQGTPPTKKPAATQPLKPLDRDQAAIGLRPIKSAIANPLQLANRGVGRRTVGNDAELYVDGDKAFNALENLIKGAKKTLYLECMIWHNDETGRRMAQAVVDAKQRGVDVKVIVDSVGLNFGDGRHNDPSLLKWMADRGVQVGTYNKGFVTNQGVAITHHKIYIADNEKMLTGGMNIGNEYANEWHDMLVGIEGPAARETAKEFAINWTRTTGQKLVIPDAPVDAVRKTPPGTAAVGIAVTDPIAHRYQMRETNLRLINGARLNIKVQMPYASDDSMMNALKAAVKRGVKVEFIMPDANDTETFNAIDHGEAVDLVKAGVDVKFFSGGTKDGKEVSRFSHLKMMIVDDAVAQVGSGNWDHRTFYNNNELNAYIADTSFVGTLKREVWDKDWQESQTATPASLAKRPTGIKIKGAIYRKLDAFF